MMVLPFAEQVRKLCLETIRAAEKLPYMGSTINNQRFKDMIEEKYYECSDRNDMERKISELQNDYSHVEFLGMDRLGFSVRLSTAF